MCVSADGPPPKLHPLTPLFPPSHARQTSLALAHCWSWLPQIWSPPDRRRAALPDRTLPNRRPPSHQPERSPSAWLVSFVRALAPRAEPFGAAPPIAASLMRRSATIRADPRSRSNPESSFRNVHLRGTRSVRTDSARKGPRVREKPRHASNGGRTLRTSGGVPADPYGRERSARYGPTRRCPLIGTCPRLRPQTHSDPHAQETPP